MRHERWLNTALRVARKSEFWPYKMGCIVVKSGRIVGSGVNKHSIAETKDPRYNLGRGIHAELAAVLSACKSLDGADAYIAGWTRGNNILCSKPCDLCEQLLKESGIRNVYYYNRDREIECKNNRRQ